MQFEKKGYYFAHGVLSRKEYHVKSSHNTYSEYIGRAREIVGKNRLVKFNEIIKSYQNSYRKTFNYTINNTNTDFYVVASFSCNGDMTGFILASKRQNKINGKIIFILTIDFIYVKPERNDDITYHRKLYSYALSYRVRYFDEIEIVIFKCKVNTKAMFLVKIHDTKYKEAVEKDIKAFGLKNIEKTFTKI